MDSKDKNEMLRLQDRIFELEAERRELLQQVHDEQQTSQELREQLEAVNEAYQQLLSKAGPRVIVTRGSDEENVYIASAKRQHFHRPNCEYSQYIQMSANLIEFGSHAEAVQAGYKPCKTCRS